MSLPNNILYPTAWKLEDIQPELHVYRHGKDLLKIPTKVPPISTALLLNSNGYLNIDTSPPTTTRLIFVAHGFRNSVETEWMTHLKDALLTESETTTVVLVSWGHGSNLYPIEYLQAAANIKTVAEWLAPHASAISLIVPHISIWGIGHSLGSHLIGMTGRLSGVFQRITGLDPAGPAFEHGEFLQLRLQSSDATDLVDVIHTDGYDTILDPCDWFAPVNHYGTLIPLGTLDFYPNWGYRQPGSGPFRIAGSHTRAIDLFIWSVLNPGKFATQSQLDGTPGFEKPVKEVKEVEGTPAEMGFHAFNGTRMGLYYVETNSEEPWIGPKTLKTHYVNSIKTLSDSCMVM